MAELLPENLWVNLTVVIPGLVTYGSWRLFLLSGECWRINQDLLNKIDKSAVLSVSLITAIAILQQTVAILLEPLFGHLCAALKKQGWSDLFLGRFKMIAKGELNEDSKRSIGQFFLSLNVLVGQIFLLCYFLWFEGINAKSGMAIVLYCIIGVLLLTCLFRACNAKEVISVQSNS